MTDHLWATEGEIQAQRESEFPSRERACELWAEIAQDLARAKRILENAVENARLLKEKGVADDFSTEIAQLSEWQQNARQQRLALERKG